QTGPSAAVRADHDDVAIGKPGDIPHSMLEGHIEKTLPRSVPDLQAKVDVAFASVIDQGDGFAVGRPCNSPGGELVYTQVELLVQIRADNLIEVAGAVSTLFNDSPSVI